MPKTISLFIEHQDMFGIETKAVNDTLRCCFEFSLIPMRHSNALISVDFFYETRQCLIFSLQNHLCRDRIYCISIEYCRTDMYKKTFDSATNPN